MDSATRLTLLKGHRILVAGNSTTAVHFSSNAPWKREDLQTAWVVEAFHSMKATGYVGVAFLWNLDFTDMTSETGAFHILNRRAYTSLARMVK